MKTVVIVDDREDNRALLLATLEHRDYRLVEASSGEEALKLIGKEEPDESNLLYCRLYRRRITKIGKGLRG